MGTFAAVLLGTAAVMAATAAHPAGPESQYYITPTEMLEVYGSYPLSNGDVLTISREHRRYWAEMKRTGRFEIEPVDSIVFVEKGGSIRLSFEPLPFTTEVQVDGLGDPAAPPLTSLWGQSGSGVEREFRE